MGLRPEATSEEVKLAYKKLARKYQPDVSQEPDAQEKFQEIGEAYDVLKNTDKREQYDQLRHFGATGTADGGYDFNGSPFNGSFDDLLQSIFGKDYAATSSPQPRDLHYKLEVEAEEICIGGTRNIRLSGAAGDRSVLVKIPIGLSQGQELRLKGMGLPGTANQAAGDLYLEITLRPHSLFVTEGNDVVLTLPVAPWEAALGAKVEVPTLRGRVNLKIAANSQSGQKLRLKGQGLPGKDGSRGDQYVQLEIVNPDVNSQTHKALFARLEEAFDFNPREALRSRAMGSD